MQVTPTGAFLRGLRKLSSSDAADTEAALIMFVKSPRAPSLNFEKVKSRKGYFTIRSNYSVRILLRYAGPEHFEAVAVGNHDYIYESYFR
ncbi:MAG: hypothetical protein QOD25_2664 [Alphaproteobacteria bacterium]|jgi:plasmid maintenance system killer protein|nr:hypothetical protein [Alphaproteobacteria bacterium]